MNNNAIIRTKDIVSFKDDISIIINHFCDDMSQEDIYKLQDIINRKIDRFCICCLTFKVDYEEANSMKIKGDNNNDK